MKAAWPIPSSLPRSLFRSLGAAVVALIVLLPKTTEAEVVEDYERAGEYEEDGMRFGAIVVKGELLPSANAPGGWSLVRTYENKSSEAAEITVEERVESTEQMYGARVSGTPTIVLQRTQKLRLAANEKKSIGTYLPEKLGQAIAKGHRDEALSRAVGMNATMRADGTMNLIAYNSYSVSYLRPLAPGETAAPPMLRGSPMAGRRGGLIDAEMPL